MRGGFVGDASTAARATALRSGDGLTALQGPQAKKAGRLATRSVIRTKSDRSPLEGRGGKATLTVPPAGESARPLLFEGVPPLPQTGTFAKCAGHLVPVRNNDALL